MTTEMAKQDSAALLEQVVVGGDLSRLSAGDRMKYYRAVCESVGLNPLTRPFDYLTLNGRMVLYAKRDATDQLRAIHGVSVSRMEKERFDDLFVVTAYAKNKEGREDSSTGAVSIGNLRGEALANAIMKAETKAKRRVTLSLCGLGLLDETEAANVPGAEVGGVDMETGELLGEPMTGGVVPPGAKLEPAGPDRDVLLARVQAGFDKLAMKASDRVALCERLCGVPTPEDAEVADLQLLLAELTRQFRAKK